MVSPKKCVIVNMICIKCKIKKIKEEFEKGRNCCRECRKQQKRDYYAKNKDAMNVKNKKWLNDNKERRKSYRREYLKKYRAHKRNTDPCFVLNERMSGAMRKILGGRKNASWLKYVDWTVKELKEHLESKFSEGMSWDNYKEWHIDHVIPKSWFQFEDANDPEFKKCWALDNLQPLWVSDNCKKGNRSAGNPTDIRPK